MNKKIILLADDDRDDIEMFCEALEMVNENVICECAENGDQAWRMLNDNNEKPQLIFLDINMPIMNGWECLKLIKKDENYQDIPVIMISTSSHKNDMETASKLGALGYFVKPNDFNDLKSMLKIITSNEGTDLSDALHNLQNSGSKYIFHL
ncbi:response regulator [Flavobacterium johnsoniae]|jgi:CheY-like chemotaxis protein|uniref:Response regulator receiver protein n=1 Tax=Flavobacterium johnsoniae (strain ATCC 17061 / DSM 2064 / JCM 8514 / BCRC 14874 / CCUG 350202 / NBRC 14942 / NCIMB 11054 / UW101) TaxID=376686 RepID=A5FF03_FLAJ1|nr:response regulator [Flavobacterium johnsoniae]ABQ06218.1 response regulator receiver protein [Flavobacterium johnsoniae UW101]OXE98311.1 response regulator [Flavobacterium johnsoniae UW101]WQG81964.1 response regulator [Flavobacterium johnsoniae UW101]SHK69178.1 Response regulator receiver domain-containing protein [Flavobacterium johnsoniae]